MLHNKKADEGAQDGEYHHADCVLCLICYALLVALSTEK
jgi:hypothetical protein